MNNVVRNYNFNVSSVSDRKAAPAALAYTASKFGLRAFGESLRLA